MWVCACLLLGQASVLFFSTKVFVPALSVAFLVFCAFAWRKNRSVILSFIVLASFTVAGRLLGSTVFNQKVTLPQPVDAASPYMCDGVVDGAPQELESGWRLDVELIGCGEGLSGTVSPANGKVRLFTAELFDALNSGDRIRFLARFKKPREFKNPGSFNYPIYLLTQGISGTGSLVGPKWIVKIGGKNLTWPSRIVSEARLKIDGAISVSAQGDIAGILKAIIIGKRDGISQETRDAFSKTGLAHLLAISGLHVGYVAVIMFFFIRLLVGWWPRLSLFWPLQRIAAIASLPVVWLYVVVAGFPVSAIRAAIMLTVFLVSLFSLWRRDLLSALATAVFAILIVSPSSVFSVSFQLSAASVFAIIVLTPAILEKIDRWPKAHCILQIAAVTIAATLGSAPIVAYNFHFVSAIGLFANIVAVPFTGIILMPLAISASVFSLIYAPLAVPIWKLAAIAAGALLRFVAHLDQYGSPLVISWAPSIAEVCLVYAAIAVIVFWNRLACKRIIAGAVAAFLVIDVGYWHARPIMGRTLEVTFLDVGHGDSIVVRFPNNHVVLIDGGGIKGSDFDVGERVVSPALLRMGIHRVDEMILTHPHHDHYKGLAAIAQRFRPRVLYTNGGDAPENELSDWEDFMQRIKESCTPIQVISGSGAPTPAFSMEEGDAKLDVFAPKATELSILDPNDTSLVIKISYGEKSLILTGDIMEMGERILLEGRPPVSGDVIKIGHHGSETSTSQEFLSAVNPSVAVITVGENDQYGLPDRIVLNRLNEIGAKIYRTDIDGAVTVRTDGKSLNVDTFVNRGL